MGPRLRGGDGGYIQCGAKVLGVGPIALLIRVDAQINVLRQQILPAAA